MVVLARTVEHRQLPAAVSHLALSSSATKSSFSVPWEKEQMLLTAVMGGVGCYSINAT